MSNINIGIEEEKRQGCLKKVGIVGAGPGGLATAIALKKKGIEVQIYERARAFLPIGAGLTLSPNGLRSLKAIDPDIVRQLKSQGSQIKRFKVRTSKWGLKMFLLLDNGDGYISWSLEMISKLVSFGSLGKRKK